MANKIQINLEEITKYIIEGKTVKELQEIYNCSRTFITDFKRTNNLVGLSPNSKKLNREIGEKVCTSCNLLLPFSEFYSNGYTNTGKQKFKSKCNKCSNLESKLNFYSLIQDYLITNSKTYTCSKCKVTGPNGFLDFHHIDPSTKEFEIGSVSKNISLDKFIEDIVPELDKCILLCPNCHRLEHLLMGL